MTNQFYLTLPSSSNISNSAATFITTLPRHILLSGEWEVGLVEIIYANTWHNVSSLQNKIKFIDTETGKLEMLKIPAARYANITDLIGTIHQALRKLKPTYADHIKLIYNQYSKLCEFTTNIKYVTDLVLSNHLQYMLGFKENPLLFYQTEDIVLVKAVHPPDMFGGMHYFYIYCDIAEPQVVGNMLAPLLQVINVEGDYMQIVNHSYISPHYIPVLKKSFNNIEINIKNDIGDPVPFQFGKTIIKLHFRRISAG